MSGKTLIILESGSKVKKVQSFVGPNYIVRACYGHIRDINRKSLNIDIENDFKPKYSIQEEKKQVVNELKAVYSKCDNILLATDLDREGESIAYHLSEVLKVKKKERKRLIFSEITKNAIHQSLESPKDLNMNIFYAQQARRLLDRLIGYSISPILWKQIQNSYEKKISLSAGRVQSVVLKLIIEREKEIENFKGNKFFKTEALFNYGDTKIKAYLSEDLEDIDTIKEFLTDCTKSEFIVKDVDLKKSTRKPSAPFITSSLQQEASLKFKMSPKMTMKSAQTLYENGYITYMRTDSLALSEEFLEKCTEYITEKYGEPYLSIRRYKSKSNSSQEAHEAIRPCSIEMNDINHDETVGSYEKKLYKLIWNRTIASQMSNCKVDLLTTKIEVSMYDEPYFISKAEKITFDGFYKIYTEHKNADSDSEEENTAFLKLKIGAKLNYKSIESNEKESRPKHLRFTEASLIKKLDELEIGRPSTYANMCSVVQDRKYVERKDIEGITKEMVSFQINKTNNDIIEKKNTIKQGGEKQKLVPNEIGFIVNEFMEKNFNSIINYTFTSELEKKLDKIGEGKLNWIEVLREIYNIFNPICLTFNTNSNNNRVRDTKKRIIGKHPKFKTDMSSYIGKYGPVVHFKDNNNNDKFAPIGNFKIEKINVKEAMSLFMWPKKLNDDIIIKKGKFGLYFNYKTKNYSLKDIPEDEITIEKCLELTKANSNNNLIKKIGETIEIKNGKYGPYIQYKKKNYKIYKQDPKTITEEICMKIINKK